MAGVHAPATSSVEFHPGRVSMLMSSWAMSGAASQVRIIDGNLERLLGELVAQGVWTGPDAERFAQDWYDQVHTPLVNAANKMDSISFEILE